MLSNTKLIGIAAIVGTFCVLLIAHYARKRMPSTRVPFWLSVFSDDGVGSFSRCASAFLIVNVVAWGWIVILHTHELPYIALVAVTPFTLQFYVANVVTKAATQIGTKPPAPQQTIVAERGDVTQTNK